MIQDQFSSNTQNNSTGYFLFQRMDNHLQSLCDELENISGGPANLAWARKKMEIIGILDQAFRSPPEGFENLTHEERKKYGNLLFEKWGGDEVPQAGLREILQSHEWITIPKFGEGLNKAALLISIHSDHDKDFQRRILALIEKKFMDPQLSALGGYAHLYDRECITFVEISDAKAAWQSAVAFEKSRPQRYASQGQHMPDGVWQPYETEDFDKVDERRRRVGLPTLRDYFNNKMNNKIPNIDSHPIVPIPLNAPTIYK